MRSRKYGNITSQVYDMKFHSIKEGKRYAELMLLQKAKLISDLKTQVEFELIPSQQTSTRKERPIKYIADFVYNDQQGNRIVEDTKGFRTPEYVLKRKLMFYIHKIEIKET